MIIFKDKSKDNRSILVGEINLGKTHFTGYVEVSKKLGELIKIENKNINIVISYVEYLLGEEITFIDYASDWFGEEYKDRFFIGFDTGHYWNKVDNTNTLEYAKEKAYQLNEVISTLIENDIETDLIEIENYPDKLGSKIKEINQKLEEKRSK